MKTSIAPLVEGDLIQILAPAKTIEPEHVLLAKTTLEQKGFRVEISTHCLGESNYFSGSIDERISDFQGAIDNPEVKGILCARGGYGCVQIVDTLNWDNIKRHPKWIIGFSDITVLHQRMSRLGLKSIHATMPLNFSSNTKAAIDSLVEAITGVQYEINTAPTPFNKPGQAKGELMGGNLSILYSLLGTNDHADFKGSILFIEDLAEHIYAIDRMFYALKKTGVLYQINGLIVGGMTGLKDTTVPFGKSYQEVILSHFEGRDIPICFDFPAGHIDDNRALVFGADVEFTATKRDVTLIF